LATVRIYKVAELLGTTSQEVVELLNKQHGIVVKSASSTGGGPIVGGGDGLRRECAPV